MLDPSTLFRTATSEQNLYETLTVPSHAAPHQRRSNDGRETILKLRHVSEQWMRLGVAPPPGVVPTGIGAIVVGLAVFAPLFGTTAQQLRGKSEATNYSLWDLRDTTPGVGWLIAGAVLLLAAAVISRKHGSPILGSAMLGVVAAEVFGLLLAMTIGFAQLADRLDKTIEFRWRIAFLVIGVAVLVCGGVGSQQWADTKS